MHIQILLAIVLGIVVNVDVVAQQFQWRKLLDSAQTQFAEEAFYSTAFDQVNNRVFYLSTGTNPMKLRILDLDNLSTTGYDVTRPIARIDNFTYDPVGDRLIFSRSGRDVVYAVNLTTLAVASIGTGALDNDSYGSLLYWNKQANKPEFFAGYGFMTAKNWVYRNTGTGWSLVFANQSNCEPRKRTSTHASLGHPDSNHIFISSGQGNCTGNQYETSCIGGAAWASDVGKWCWLKDMYKFDVTGSTFTNVRAFSDPTYIGEGPIAYDYHNQVMYQFPRFVPSSTWGVAPTIYDTTYVYSYVFGDASGYKRVQVSGQIPPMRSSGAVFYDGPNRRVVLVRTDGVWALEIGQGSCPFSIATQPVGATVKDGQQVSLSIVVNNATNPAYKWQRKDGASWIDIANDSRYFGAATSKLTIESAQSSKAGPYRCVVTAGGCTLTSNEAALTVNCNCTTN